MPRADQPYPGSADSGYGLRALATLINDVLAAMGTRPAFALPAPLPGATRMATEITTPVARAGRGRAHAETSHSASPGAPQPAEPGVVEEHHVETWRLVTLAQGGDGEAFGQLYDRYVDIVFRFVYYRVNDRAMAEDFTSETFLRALRRISTITYQGRDIGAWFITIARNIVLDHMKSARHRLEITTADTIEGRDAVAGPEAAVIGALTSARLMSAVKQLGEEQRDCVMLRFIQGFSVSETASVMGKNDGAIKALQHRAVRKLAEIVGEDLR